jgi:hypothetical protein
MNATQLKKLQVVIRKHHPGKRGATLSTTAVNKERQVIYGGMLGDGGTWYNRINLKCNESYHECHQIGHIEYAKWKMSFFAKWNVKWNIDRRIDRRKGFVRSKPEIYFRTSYCPFFTIIGHKFYKRYDDGNYILRQRGSRMERIKHLPWDVFDVLGSKKNEGLGLAVWYMDDGSVEYLVNYAGERVVGYYGSPRIRLCTESFSLEENNRIKDWFCDRWNIVCNVIKISDSHRISFTSDGTKKFLKIVKPWVKQVSCMHYKLGLNI